MKKTTIDRALMSALRPEITDALAALGTKYGIQISVGNGRYTADHAQFKIQMDAIGEGGTAIRKEAKDFTRQANTSWSELQPEWLGATFQSRGQTFTVVGYRTRAPKNNILCASQGKEYVFTTPALVRLMSA